MDYRYIHVSIQEQNEGRRVIALLDSDISEKRLMVYKVSGKDFDHIDYRKGRNSSASSIKTNGIQ